ncbi:MAG: hypothetical protein WBW99_12785 [Pseudolabrys sp.]
MVDIVLGPFAAFELLATVIAQAKMPTLAFALVARLSFMSLNT